MTIEHYSDNNPTASANSGPKRGRGRPAKAGGAKKSTGKSESAKRGRGRPSKSGGTSSPAKKGPAAIAKREKSSSSVDASKKKRGRPSKSSTPTEQTNGISKPQVCLINEK